MSWHTSESITKHFKQSIRYTISKLRKHQLLGLFARQLPQTSFQTVAVPRGDVPRTEPGNGHRTTQSVSSSASACLAGRLGVTSYRDFRPACFVLSLASRLRFPRRLQALWKQTILPYMGLSIL